MIDREKWAFDEINRILVDAPGQLQIITAQHRCGCTKNGSDPQTDEQQAICEKYSREVCSIRQPGHFVCNPVIRVDEPGDNGKMVAYSEKDWTSGKPFDVLKRLQIPFEADMAGFNLPELGA